VLVCGRDSAVPRYDAILGGITLAYVLFVTLTVARLAARPRLFLDPDG
jgi:hypothetical protein